MNNIDLQQLTQRSSARIAKMVAEMECKTDSGVSRAIYETPYHAAGKFQNVEARSRPAECGSPRSQE